jgi:hypothetical protein
MQARERWLAWGAGGIVGLWLLDLLLIEPGLGWYRAVQEDTLKTKRSVAEAQILVDHANRIHAAWRGEHAAGLLDDEDAARFRLQQALAGSARRSGVVVDSVGGGQRIPAPHGTAYDTIRSTVTCQGSLGEILAFLAGLEAAAQPLRIERCELAARDGRKDQLDAALTISTRIASSEARALRRIPVNQKPWSPAARDPALDQAVLAAKPFLNDRRSDRRNTANSDAPAATPDAKPGGLALVGIVTRPGREQGFLRDLGSGNEQQIAVGDQLGPDTVAEISPAGLRLRNASGERLIAVGCDLTGQPLAAASGGGDPHLAVPTSGAATPATIPTSPGSSPAIDREAILQRLREQRNRSR